MPVIEPASAEAIGPDRLVREHGWACFRVPARKVRVGDVVLPGTYNVDALPVKVLRPFAVEAVTSVGSSHVVGWWWPRAAKWWRINGDIDVVILRAPEDDPEPLAWPREEGDAG